MAIASLPMGIPPNVFYYRETISNTVEDWDLEEKLIAAGWDEVQRVDAKVTVSNSGLVGSSSLTSAMNFEGMPTDSLIILENHGRIFGVGGGGANGAGVWKEQTNDPYIFIDPFGGDGGSGGRAIWVRTSIILRNFGKIYGGGGGGAGGAAAGIATQVAQVYGYAGGGGGGGFGYPGFNSKGRKGSNGTDYNQLNTPPQTLAKDGQNGTTTSGGDGGTGGIDGHDSNDFRGSKGGDGGGPGQFGQDTADGKACGANYDIRDCKEGFGGSGGNAGQAINGHSYITYEAVGDIKGAILN